MQSREYQHEMLQREFKEIEMPFVVGHTDSQTTKRIKKCTAQNLELSL